MLVKSGRVWQDLIGPIRVGGADVCGLPPRIVPNGPCLQQGDISPGAQKRELGLRNEIRRGWEGLVGSGRVSRVQEGLVQARR